MEKLKTLLVANRGEIAARIIRSAKYAPEDMPEVNWLLLALTHTGSLGYVPLPSTPKQMQHLLMLLTQMWLCFSQEGTLEDI